MESLEDQVKRWNRYYYFYYFGGNMGKYCKRLDGYVDADFQDCSKCGQCQESKR
jgi:hypothetical protein